MIVRTIPWLLLTLVLLLPLSGCGRGTSPEASATAEETATPAAETTLVLDIDGHSFTAILADTDAARTLAKHLAEAPLSLSLRDYGGFEKVGSLGMRLPADDVQTTTEAGDIVLYQGNQIVLFYGSNNWAYTRLAHVRDTTGWADALASDNIQVTLSLAE